MKSDSFCEEIDGNSIKYFIDLSTRTKTDVIAGIIERENSNNYNSLFHKNLRVLLRLVRWINHRNFVNLIDHFRW